jgi:cytochrome oxidase Cu insertion factor (SCO1/SenC/PrrC family)
MVSPQTPRRIQPWSLWLIVALLLGGVVVCLNYIKKNRAEAQDPRPPYLGKLERDLETTNQDGTPVYLASLKGQIWLASCLSTESSINAPELVRLLKEVWEEFAGDPRLHCILFSANPTGDTPEKRTQFLRSCGVDDPRWWFLATKDPQQLTQYLVRYLRLLPFSPVADPERRAEWGPFEHDLRVVLVDGKANLRGQYAILDPVAGRLHRAQLGNDLRYLLQEAPGGKATTGHK